jgi:outer membrane biosynthesis protein TonB
MRAFSTSVVLVAALAACGGHRKAATMPEVAAVPTAVEPAGNDGSMETPESLEAITSALDRKRPMAARCLSEAVDAKALPRNAHGKITLEFMIGTDGKASTIKVVKASLESEQLSACVVSVVERITFPTLQRSRQWSYTYAFEAM